MDGRNRPAVDIDAGFQNALQQTDQGSDSTISTITLGLQGLLFSP
jgi:hypothetical protein